MITELTDLEVEFIKKHCGKISGTHKTAYQIHAHLFYVEVGKNLFEIVSFQDIVYAYLSNNTE